MLFRFAAVAYEYKSAPREMNEQTSFSSFTKDTFEFQLSLKTSCTVLKTNTKCQGLWRLLMLVQGEVHGDPEGGEADLTNGQDNRYNPHSLVEGEVGSEVAEEDSKVHLFEATGEHHQTPERARPQPQSLPLASSCTH